MKFRQPIESDLEWLIKEWSSVDNVEKIHSFSHANAKEVKSSAEHCLSRPEMVIVVEMDSKPVGLAQLDVDIFKKCSHNAFFCILVTKEYRNKGIGATLCKQLIELARSKFNVKMLYLEVMKGNPAIHLYNRLGFIQCGCEPRFLRSGLRLVDKIIMYMEL